MEPSWIEIYGPWAVFLGAIFEGETVFIAAGYALSQGYMDPISTFILAVIGGSLGDVTCYALGRRYGSKLIQKTPFLWRTRDRAVLLLHRWGRATAFMMRFAYGLRIILPVSVGAAKFPWIAFLPFNLLGSVTFAGFYITLGYFFGEALEELFSRMTGYEWWILLGIWVVGAVVWIIREWKIYHAGENVNKEEV